MNHEDKYYHYKEERRINVFRIFFYTAIAILAILAAFVQFIYPQINTQP